MNRTIQAGLPRPPLISIDTSRTQGTLRSLRGMCGPPIPSTSQAQVETDFFGWASFLRYTGRDMRYGYTAARIDFVRTHDMWGHGDIDSRYQGDMELLGGGALDLSTFNTDVIFPNLDADPNDPASYNFGPTDRMIQAIRDVGAQILFRIGRTFFADTTPPDVDRYAAIVRRVAQHYNQGWANGFYYNIRHWEVWNEPDYDLPLGFWSGTPEEFYVLYEKVVRTLKEVDPELLVGGPAISLANDVTPFREGFIEYVSKRRVPLDFFSWHWYSNDANDPLDFTRIAADLRKLLDSNGLFKTELYLDEWNCGIRASDADSLTASGRASFVASALIYMQDSPIDRACFYNGYGPFGTGTRPDKVGQALIAIGKLKDTTLRLPVSGATDDGFACIAGTTSDQRLTQILVSNYRIPAQYLSPRPNGDSLEIPQGIAGGRVTMPARREISYKKTVGYRLSINNLRPDRLHVVTRHRITNEDDWRLYDETSRSGVQITMDSDLAPQGIELIAIQCVS